MADYLLPFRRFTTLSSTLAFFLCIVPFRPLRFIRFSFRCPIYIYLYKYPSSAYNCMCFNYFKWLKQCNKFWCETSSNKLSQCILLVLLLLLLLLVHSNNDEHASIHFRIDAIFCALAYTTMYWKECGHTE